jgi:hypothetical protein
MTSLFQVREESEENVRREAEAVEQVKRSVQVAEQARMEKHELEFEIEQLKMQVRGNLFNLIELTCFEVG